MNSVQKKRLAERMAADHVWDQKHGIKEGSPEDKRIDAKVRAKALKG